MEHEFDWYLKEAKKGDAAAQVDLATCYLYGVGVQHNCAKAIEWYRKAIENKHPTAQHLLDLYYSREKEFSDLQKAAQNGDAEAQYKLGKYYLQGSVIVSDEKTGELSEYDYYHNGEVVKKDVLKGAEWLLKAAHKGHAPAQVKLGECYRRGEGVAQDSAKAIEWFRKAEKQGYSDGQFELGCCYMEGSGVPQDYDKAAELFTKAAKQEHGFARDYLAERKNWKEIERKVKRALKNEE